MVYSLDDILVQKPMARLLKPAFVIIRARSSKCLLLLIRGTPSITLTAATGWCCGPIPPFSVAKRWE